MAIDAMSSRYGLLPSEVMNRASTFDLFVYDSAISYINHVQNKADGAAPEVDQETLLSIVNKRKKQSNENEN